MFPLAPLKPGVSPNHTQHIYLLLTLVLIAARRLLHWNRSLCCSSTRKVLPAALRVTGTPHCLRKRQMTVGAQKVQQPARSCQAVKLEASSFFSPKLNCSTSIPFQHAVALSPAPSRIALLPTVRSSSLCFSF